jgi:hypothetical protein
MAALAALRYNALLRELRMRGTANRFWSQGWHYVLVCPARVCIARCDIVGSSALMRAVGSVRLPHKQKKANQNCKHTNTIQGDLFSLRASRSTVLRSLTQLSIGLSAVECCIIFILISPRFLALPKAEGLERTRPRPCERSLRVRHRSGPRHRARLCLRRCDPYIVCCDQPRGRPPRCKVTASHPVSVSIHRGLRLVLSLGQMRAPSLACAALCGGHGR